MSGIVKSIFGGSSSGSGAQSTSSSSQADPRVVQAYLDNINRTNQAITTLPTQQYAPFSADQQSAFQMIRNNATSGVGQNATMAGLNTTANLGNFGARDVTGGSFLNQNLAAYMNPYLENVATNTLTGLDRARQMAMGDNSAAAIRNNAFGGSRQSVLDAETNRNFFDVANRSIADLYAGGFNNAAALAGQDLNRNLTAQQSNQAADINSANVRLAAGSQLGDLGKLYQTLGYTDAAALENVGAQQQALSNQLLNAERDSDILALQLANAAVGTSPSGFSTSTTSSGSTKGKGLFETIFG